ncbi:MAG: hypothetical protein ACK4VN_13775 [Bacteroidales bacterium]
MERNQTVILVVAIALMILAGCGGGAQDGEGRTTSQASKKINLPNDPCELVFHVISTMNKGPETFEAAILDLNDFRQIKKDFPDLETYYDLWEENIKTLGIYDYPASDAFRMIFLERMAATKNINLSSMFDDFIEGYYNMIRDGAIRQQLVWDEIKLNDCSHRTVRYDIVSYKDENGRYQDLDISAYTLPEIFQTRAHIFMNGKITEWPFTTVKTKQGWKLFFPHLNWIRDEMEYEY